MSHVKQECSIRIHLPASVADENIRNLINAVGRPAKQHKLFLPRCIQAKAVGKARDLFFRPLPCMDVRHATALLYGGIMHVVEVHQTFEDVVSVHHTCNISHLLPMLTHAENMLRGIAYHRVCICNATSDVRLPKLGHSGGPKLFWSCTCGCINSPSYNMSCFSLQTSGACFQNAHYNHCDGWSLAVQ